MSSLHPVLSRDRQRGASYKPEWRPRRFRTAAVAVGHSLREYALLMRLHRPIGIWLLAWPTLWALWLAGQGRPDQRVLVTIRSGAPGVLPCHPIAGVDAPQRLHGTMRRVRPISMTV